MIKGDLSPVKLTGKFILIILSSGVLYAQKIAVMDFVPRGEFSQQEISILSDRFRSELVMTHKFEVMERQELDELNRELGIQRTAEFSKERVARAGEKIGAKYVVIGYMGKLGSLYTIDIKMVNCETSQIETSYNDDYRGNVEGLVDIMSRLAKKMAGVENKGRVWRWIGAGAGIIIGGVVYAILTQPAPDMSLPLPPQPPAK